MSKKSTVKLVNIIETKVWCNKCGMQTIIYELDEQDLLNRGWYSEDNYHLCPQCYTLHARLRNIWKKRNKERK